MKKIFILFAIIFSFDSAQAQIRETLIVWQEPTENVDGSQMSQTQLTNRNYRVYFGVTSRNYTESAVVLDPEPSDTGGLQSMVLLPFPDVEEVFVAMTCFYPPGVDGDTEQESAYSNEIRRTATLRVLPPVIEIGREQAAVYELNIFSFGKREVPQKVIDEVLERFPEIEQGIYTMEVDWS